MTNDQLIAGEGLKKRIAELDTAIKEARRATRDVEIKRDLVRPAYLSKARREYIGELQKSQAECQEAFDAL